MKSPESAHRFKQKAHSIVDAITRDSRRTAILLAGAAMSVPGVAVVSTSGGDKPVFPGHHYIKVHPGFFERVYCTLTHLQQLPLDYF
jgi:hypothetical protein